ncbi:hypothetical protein Nepgr_029410 [Nepenthes gracilis]|uniref:Uncharacterized protein n=1 Tax=Nepenthes gracilis TaxID=150966 RepID=A0AAD3Y2Z8_NEPGR|nr:hypothetical protein Nepgr_029410 [Nepenthes gracilis]
MGICCGCLGAVCYLAAGSKVAGTGLAGVGGFSDFAAVVAAGSLVVTVLHMRVCAMVAKTIRFSSIGLPRAGEISLRS